MGSDCAGDSLWLGNLPPEILGLIVAHLDADRDLCRARAAHRCFHTSPVGEVERRLARWRGRKSPEQFCAAGLVEALAVVADRGAALGPACVWAAVEHGHRDVLVFLVAHGVQLDVGPRRRLGAVRAPSDSVWRGAPRHTPRHADLVAAAAAGGHLDVILFLYANGVAPAPGPAAIDSAAANGHLSVVKWLHTIPYLTATTDAMDRAAAAGHLDVVRFLDEHRTEGCTVFAMTQAAVNGHLDVVAYLHEHRTEGCINSTYNQACAAGQSETSYYLLVHNIGMEHHSARLREQFMGFYLASGAATAQIRADESGGPAPYDGSEPLTAASIARMLDTLGGRTDVMNLAAQYGLLAVVEWLHENCAEGCTTEAMDGAALAGHLHVVQWLHVHRTEGCTEAALASTHPGIVRFLLAHRPADCRRPKLAQ